MRIAVSTRENDRERSIRREHALEKIVDNASSSCGITIDQRPLWR
jgi:hypothetical protein